MASVPQAAVRLADLMAQIRDERVRQGASETAGGARGLGPAQVRVGTVHGHSDHFAVERLEFGNAVVKGDNFGGANKTEVGT